MRWLRSCLALAGALGCGDADTSMIGGNVLGEQAPLAPADTLGTGAAGPGNAGAPATAAEASPASCVEPRGEADSCGASTPNDAASAAAAPIADSASEGGADDGSSEPSGGSSGNGPVASGAPGSGAPGDGTEGSATHGPGKPGDGGSNGGDGATGSEVPPGDGAPSSGSGDPLPGSDPWPEPLPDLIVDGTYLMATVQEDVVDASADMCLFAEGCVNGPGARRVVRFGTRSANVGAADVVVGRPEAGNPSWEFDACHEHFHFEGYASYELLTSTGEVLPIGNKNGFCLRDLDNWTGSASCGRYDCDYQGIGVGCADVYTPDLDCQWIDITDVAPGTYELVVTVNTENVIVESDMSNNSASVTIEILVDTVRVLP